MKCLSCGKDNRDGARFCVVCGTTLRLACPACAREIQSTERFCPFCGREINPLPGPPRDTLGALKPGALLQNHYRIDRFLVKGGFGYVYRAHDLQRGSQPCAIKELLDRSEESQRQFEREASLLTRLRHKGLVRVYDYFDTLAGELFLVMEYVEGDDLEQVRRKAKGFLPETRIINWALQVCDVLEYMHTWVDPTTRQPSPVIHRDIKPENIRLGPSETITIIDLGIAKVKEPGRKTTLAAQAVSPPYSPIEQYGMGTDERSDIYALGATLYHLATGSEPPEAPDLLRLSLIPPRQLNRALSLGFQEVVLKAMQTRPENRFQTVRDMEAALRGGSGPATPARDLFQTVHDMVAALKVRSSPAPRARDSSHQPVAGSPSQEASAYVERGSACFAEGKWSEAIENFTQALALDPDNPVAHFGRGGLRLQQGDLLAAIADLDRGIELALSHPALGPSAPIVAGAYFQRGRARAEQGDLTGAIADYDRAIKLDPDNAGTYNNRGLIRAEQDDLPGAIDDYSRAIKLDPALGAAYSNRGLAFAAQGDLVRAVANYNWAIALLRDERQGGAYYNRGLARKQQGDLPGAIFDYDEAIMLDPSLSEAFRHRGLARAAQGDLAGAIADYDRAIALKPHSAEDYYYKACAHALGGNVSEACTWLEKAIGLDEQLREEASSDTDFGAIQDEPRFQALLAGR